MAVELEGLESSEKPNENENNSITTSLISSIGGDKALEEFKAHEFVYDHSAYLAYRAAYRGPGSIRYSVGIFSTRGESEHSKTSVLERNGPVGKIKNKAGKVIRDESDRGSERGAFRHALWSAQIAIEFSIEDAKLVTDTHEVGTVNMKRGFKGIDVSKTSGIKSLYQADRIADELNNIVGRNYAKSIGGIQTTKSTAIAILKKFKEEGLYIIKQSDDQTFEIIKTKLSEDKYNKLIKRWQSLDGDGFKERSLPVNFDSPIHFDIKN